MVRGEIWLVNLDPTIGAEIHKTLPALIVSVDSIGILPLKVIVPITDWKDRYAVAPWMIRIEPDTQNGLNKISAIDTFQVRSLAQQRFISFHGLALSRMEQCNRLCKVSQESLAYKGRSIAHNLGFNEIYTGLDGDCRGFKLLTSDEESKLAQIYMKGLQQTEKENKQERSTRAIMK